MDEETAAYVEKHGCFCGGSGEYADYNCGASYMLTCPHCRGSGIKKCKCVEVTLKCPATSG